MIDWNVRDMVNTVEPTIWLKSQASSGAQGQLKPLLQTAKDESRIRLERTWTTPTRPGIHDSQMASRKSV